MARRSERTTDSRIEEIPPVKVVYYYPEPEEIKLVNLTGAIINIVGPTTGMFYTFQPGKSQYVKKTDAEIMLTRKYGACCGSDPKPYFEIEV